MLQRKNLNITAGTGSDVQVRLLRRRRSRAFHPVDPKLTIRTARQLSSPENIPAHLATLEGRPIFVPDDVRMAPDPGCVGRRWQSFLTR